MMAGGRAVRRGSETDWAILSWSGSAARTFEECLMMNLRNRRCTVTRPRSCSALQRPPLWARRMVGRGEEGRPWTRCVDAMRHC